MECNPFEKGPFDISSYLLLKYAKHRKIYTFLFEKRRRGHKYSQERKVRENLQHHTKKLHRFKIMKIDEQ
jgi:hypothetical protein